MQPELRIALVPIARVHFDVELARQITHELRRNLILAGFHVIGQTELVTDAAAAHVVAQTLVSQEFDVLLAFQATFADSSIVVQLAEELEAPLLLWGVPEEITGGRLRLNSLCGLNLAAHALKRRGRKFEFVYASPSDPEGTDKLRDLALAGSVCRKLKSLRVGVVGNVPGGMDTCTYDPVNLKRQLGAEAIPLDLELIFGRILAMPETATQNLRQRLDSKLPNLAELEQEPLNRTLKAYLVLRDLAEKEALDGMAVRCWPEFFTELRCSACGALSLLIDSGLPSSCEVDVYGTITQLVLQWMSGGLAFSTDMVLADKGKDRMVLWHCGHAPLSWCDPQTG